MMFVAMQDRRISNPVILEIDPEVIKQGGIREDNAVLLQNAVTFMGMTEQMIFGFYLINYSNILI